MQAYQLRAINLGETNFLDSAPAPIPKGLIYQQYLSYFNAKQFNNSNGSKIASPDFSYLAVLNQFVYKSGHRILGLEWGFSTIIPAVIFDLTEPNALGPAPGLSNSGSGIGDIIVGPWLSPKPLMHNGRPVWANYFEFDVYLPTGRHDRNAQINTGTSYFSFEPYWSSTVFILPQWTMSWRAHMLFNTRDAKTNIRPGHAFHINWASSVEVIPHRLRLGVGTYFLKQLNNDNIGGVSIANSKETVFGIGPGAAFFLSRQTAYFFNLYFETTAKNRAKGYKAVVRMTHFFKT